jgi:hypothetical protein
LAELKAKMGLASSPEAKAALPASAQVRQDESKIPSVLTTENRDK